MTLPNRAPRRAAVWTAAVALALVAGPGASRAADRAGPSGDWPEPPTLDRMDEGTADGVAPPPWTGTGPDAPWRAGSLLGARAIGLTGEPVGTVEDLVLDADGRLAAVIVRLSGLTGTGGPRMAVPWDSATRGGDADTVRVRLTRDSTDVYATFAAPEEATLQPGQWRAEQVIGDRVESGGADDGDRSRGRVADLVFDGTDRLTGLVVTREGTSTITPFPGWGDAGDPAADSVHLPTDRGDFAEGAGGADGPPSPDR